MRLLETEFMAALDFTEPDEGLGEEFTLATGRRRRAAFRETFTDRT